MTHEMQGERPTDATAPFESEPVEPDTEPAEPVHDVWKNGPSLLRFWGRIVYLAFILLAFLFLYFAFSFIYVAKIPDQGGFYTFLPYAAFVAFGVILFIGEMFRLCIQHLAMLIEAVRDLRGTAQEPGADNPPSASPTHGS